MTARQDTFARLVLLLNLVLVPSALLGYQFVLRPALFGPGLVYVQAHIAEMGGFSPDSLQVPVGQKVTLRFSAEDMAHTIAFGPGVEIDPVPVVPGHPQEVTLSFDRPGRYTYYCTTWCSPNHWRMRGVIEVIDPAQPAPEAQRDLTIETLLTEGVDIDDAVNGIVVPAMLTRRPSVERGAAIIDQLTTPPELRDANWRRSHTPQQGMALLAVSNPTRSSEELADAAAYWWSLSAAAEGRNSAAGLYALNCAYCHGPTGNGDGFQATTTAKKPVAFADTAYLFARRDDVLYAKIRRGGMGTDMPNFGTIFTPEETWALVDYLRALSVTNP